MHNEALTTLNTQVTTTPEVYTTSRNPVCIHKPVPPPLHEDDLPISVASSSSTSLFHPNGENSSPQDNFLVFARNLFLQSTDQQLAQSNAEKKNINTAINGHVAPSTKNSLSLISPPELNPWLENPSNKIHSHHYNKQQNGLKRKANDMEGSDDGQLERENTQKAASTENELPDNYYLPTLRGLEQDEGMLEFLQKHHGDENRAKVSLLIHLSGGISKKRRKRFNRFWNKCESKTDVVEKVNPPQQLLSPLPQSQPEGQKKEDPAKNVEMMIHSYPKMLGDLRGSSRSGKYKYHLNQIQPFPKKRKKKTHDIFGSDSDDECDEYPENSWSPKSKWKLFLSMSNQIIRSTIATNTNVKKPRLRQISSLLNACMNMDPPDHSISKESTLRKIDRNISALYNLCNSGRDHLAVLMDIVHDTNNQGVDLDKAKSCIQTIEANCFVSLDEVSIVKSGMREVSKWEREVSQTLKNNTYQVMQNGDNSEEESSRNDLVIVNKLLQKSKKLFLHAKSIVQLEDKIQRACALKMQILNWEKVS